MINKFNTACKTKLIGFAAILITASFSVSVSAQLVLEEMIVTAQKRSEILQDIPISVSVVTSETLNDFSIDTAEDLATIVPGFTIEPAPQGLLAGKIRGLGTGVGVESLDQSVGLFIDGVWSGRPRDLQGALLDLQQVEIVKGSQTSQLGKNTSLGAIQLLSQRPEEETGGYGQAEFETEFDSSVIEGAFNLGTDTGNYRLAFKRSDETGFVDNLLIENDDPGREQTTVRLSGSWKLSEKASLYASYSRDDLETRGDFYQVSTDLSAGFFTLLSGDTDLTVDNNTRNAFTTFTDDGVSIDDQESDRFTLEFTYAINANTDLIYLGGYNQYDNTRAFDADFSGLNFLDQLRISSYEQTTHEIRFVGSAFNDKLDYVAGLFYLDSNFLTEETALGEATFPLPLPDLPSPPFPPSVVALTGPSNQFLEFDQDVENTSAFFQGTYSINEKLKVGLGLRFTDETRSAFWDRQFIVDETFLLNGETFEVLPPMFFGTFGQFISPNVIAANLDRDEDNLDGSFNIQYDFSPNFSAYASIARASKSGGFASGAASVEVAELETEEADTVEIGFKSSYLDDTFRFNAALFSTDIDNFQVVAFVGNGFATSTIPLETQGVEFESFWQASKSLTLGLSATYADAENTLTSLDPPGAPELSATFSLRHLASIGSNYTFTSSFLASYRDDLFSQENEEFISPALTLLDLSFAIGPSSGKWDVGLIARNLLDEQELLFSAPFGVIPLTEQGSTNRPRTISLQGSYRF